MKSLMVGSKTSYNDQVLLASNILKMSNIQLASFSFDLMKNNMKEEFITPWCKRLFVGARFHSKEETKVQLLYNREKNQDKKLKSKNSLKSSSSLIQNLGAVHLKTGAHVTYDIQLGHSLTCWKDKEIIFLMGSFDQNCQNKSSFQNVFRCYNMVVPQIHLST
jgi:hypothetical protein